MQEATRMQAPSTLRSLSTSAAPLRCSTLSQSLTWPTQCSEPRPLRRLQPLKTRWVKSLETSMASVIVETEHSRSLLRRLPTTKKSFRLIQVRTSSLWASLRPAWPMSKLTRLWLKCGWSTTPQFLRRRRSQLPWQTALSLVCRQLLWPRKATIFTRLRSSLHSSSSSKPQPVLTLWIIHSGSTTA